MGDELNDLLLRDAVLEFIVTIGQPWNPEGNTQPRRKRQKKILLPWKNSRGLECLAALLSSRFSRRVATAGIGLMTVDGVS